MAARVLGSLLNPSAPNIGGRVQGTLFSNICATLIPYNAGSNPGGDSSHICAGVHLRLRDQNWSSKGFSCTEIPLGQEVIAFHENDPWTRLASDSRCVRNSVA
jgi:hypothetical protein